MYSAGAVRALPQVLVHCLRDSWAPDNTVTRRHLRFCPSLPRILFRHRIRWHPQYRLETIQCGPIVYHTRV